jgi:small subunit ribosomal protein S20
MANIKSAKKRVLVAEQSRLRNMADRTRMKTQLKKFSAAVADGNKKAAERELVASVSILDKTASKGVIHKNAAARRKSNLYRVYNQMQ